MTFDWRSRSYRRKSKNLDVVRDANPGVVRDINIGVANDINLALFDGFPETLSDGSQAVSTCPLP